VNDHLVTTTRTAAGAPVPAHAKTDLSRVGNNARLNERRGAPAMKTYSAVRAPTSSRKPLARLSAGGLNDTGRGKELKNPPPCDPVSNIPKGRVLLSQPLAVDAASVGLVNPTRENSVTSPLPCPLPALAPAARSFPPSSACKKTPCLRDRRTKDRADIEMSQLRPPIQLQHLLLFEGQAVLRN